MRLLRRRNEGKEGRRKGRNQRKRPQTLNGDIQGWNGQTAVDGTAQVMVAHGLTPSMSDQGELSPKKPSHEEGFADWLASHTSVEVSKRGSLCMGKIETRTWRERQGRP